MKAINKHTGKTVPLDRVNIDTDQIIPKQFLKRIERTGYGKYLFYDWRFNQDGSLNIEFIASQNLSSSSKFSLSVGSIIIVPGTGKETVGAWKP